ncbi:aldo/keto reductase [Nonomuraea sp. NPDC050451]|uniref:aldo/keto reductase n=1 Tax=Nonomuraea sp. NPDC050451 TaxID=3364364 RepID=UPI003788527B
MSRSGVHCSHDDSTPIGLGGSQFSGGGAGTFWPALPQSQVDAIIKTALDGGISWFDTAEAYGAGRSERSLAAGLSRAGMAPGDVTVSTKWTPFARTARTIGDRITNLAPFPVDLHQIHAGFGSLSSIRTQVRAMAQLADAGKIRSVGVSNFSARQMKIAHEELARGHLPTAEGVHAWL